VEAENNKTRDRQYTVTLDLKKGVPAISLLRRRILPTRAKTTPMPWDRAFHLSSRTWGLTLFFDMGLGAARQKYNRGEAFARILVRV